jgi:CDP-diacylglycerol---glycerol-3-phosphate 3-phosphatidyltransferase
MHWPNQDMHPHHFEDKAEQALKELQMSYIDSILQSSHSNDLDDEKGVGKDNGSCDTLIIPVIQAGQFNIHEEERAISLLFAHLPRNPKIEDRPVIDLTSGYFSLHKAYQKLILDTSQGFRANINIIASAPKVWNH